MTNDELLMSNQVPMTECPMDGSFLELVILCVWALIRN
jgi:hypothetical protein